MLRIHLDIARLQACLDKAPESLTEEERHVLIRGVTFLSDEERQRFASVLVYENLTADEIKMFEASSPSHVEGKTFVDLYFPSSEGGSEVSRGILE